MCKSMLYAVNSATQTVAANGVINFGNPVRRYGQNINAYGGNVVVDGSGYYDISANISFEGTAGTATIAIVKDGVPVPGASSTITVAASTEYQVCIPCIVRQTCCCESTITAVVTGEELTVTNAAVVVEKI